MDMSLLCVMNLFLEKLVLGPCNALPGDGTLSKIELAHLFSLATRAEQAPRCPVIVKHSPLGDFRSKFTAWPVQSLLALNHTAEPGEEQIVLAINVELDFCNCRSLVFGGDALMVPMA